MPAKSKIPANIRAAIRSGHVPNYRPNWRRMKVDNLTRGERVCKFIEMLRVPEGPMVGQNIKLLVFQVIFILAIFDGPAGTVEKAILSVGRKNGKTAVAAGLMLAFMFMPDMCPRNTRNNSAALSREQAALLYNYMSKMLMMTPELTDLYRLVPSGKRIIALRTGIEYHALAAEAGKAMGLSPYICIFDESGQIVGPTDPFVDALLTSQGAHDDPISIFISTQAASDASLLSTMIDDAIANPSPKVVCHLYEADAECNLMAKAQWRKASPAFGEFRSANDVLKLAEEAERIPAKENSFRNLILNQRVSLNNAWLAPTIWKQNNAKPDWNVFVEQGCHIGLDLSIKNDLTAAIMSAKDDAGQIHLWTFAFTPLEGIDERSHRDKVPYRSWVDNGILMGVPGATIDYDWVSKFLRNRVERAGVMIKSVEFDRWRIHEFKAAANRQEFAMSAKFNEVGQGYRDMSPRIEAFETALLQANIRHGSHPAMNLGAASAIVVQDPAGSRKLDKAKSAQKIDCLQAAVMGAAPLIMQLDTDFDASVAFG